MVRLRGLPDSAGMKPSFLRTERGCSHTDSPWMRMSPLSGLARVAMIRSSVVLPAPLGPINPRRLTIRARED